MKPVKLIKAKHEHYSEAYQSSEIKFGFLAKLPKTMGFKELHSPVKCRDFLGDVLFSEEQEEDVCIYSFKWGSFRKPIDRDKIRLSIHFPSKDAASNFTANIGILTEIEMGAGIEPSTIHSVAEDNLCVVVEAPPLWQSSVFLISLFTFILKVMGYSFKDPKNWIKEFPTLTKSDSHYYKDHDKELSKILLHINRFINPKTVHGWSDKADTDIVHNNSGFSSMLLGYKKLGSKNSNAVIIKELMSG